jgi:hypothetical protein
MTDQTSRLSVRAIMDSGDYTRGAAEVARANRDMAASGQGVVVSLTATDGALTRAGGGAGRLARQYIDGAKGAAQFQTDLRALNTALETGKVTAEQAAAIYTGLVQRFGIVADGAAIAGQNFKQLGTIIVQTNQEMREFAQVSAAIGTATAELEHMTSAAAALRAQIDPIGASQARLNAQLAEYKTLLNSGTIGAQEFAAAETLARQRHEAFAASLNKTPLGGANDNLSSFRRQNLGYQATDIFQGVLSGQPLGMIAAQQGGQVVTAYQQAGGLSAVKTDLAALAGVAGSAAAAIGPIGLAFGAVTLTAGAFYLLTRKETKTTDEVLKEHAANIKALGDAYGIATEKAKSYSEADKAVAESATRKTSAEAIQKQKDAIEALSLQFGRYGGFRGAPPTFGTNGGYGDFLDAFKKLRSGKEDVEAFIEQVRRVGEQNGLQKQADNIISATKAAKDLNDTLAKTQQIINQISNDRGPGGFLLSQGPTNQEDAGKLAAFQAQQAVAAARAEQQLRAQIAEITARSPVQKADAARQGAAAQYNPDETSVARAQRIELAGTQALIAAEHELRVAKEERTRQSDEELAKAQYELTLIGQSVGEHNRLMAAYQAEAQIREAAARAGIAADEAEIASARKKAAAIVDANAKVSLGGLIRDQGYDAQRLQLEANLIGATADQRARATAALEAEIRLKQQGIETNTAAAQSYIAEAQALAQARQEIDRQNAAYQSLQQAQGTVIDDLVSGTGTMKDRLKAAASDVLKWFNEIAVANPLKNALTGTNLPTLGDLFSGKPQVPGAAATTTATMNVTAAVVNMSGGLPGIPGFPTSGVPGTTTTLSQFLGIGANGVRPDVVNGQIVNSPVSAAANVAKLLPTATSTTPTNMLAYQQAISQIESGSFAGNYSALGPTLKNGDYAIGRYQIMASNVPSWSQKYLGQQITPDQLRANPAAQDSIFNGEFGGYVDRYGATGAASKWFTGSATVSNKMDINGTTGNQYVNQFNANLTKLSSTTAATQSSFTGLNTSTDGLQSGFSSLSSIFGNAPASTGASGGGFLSSFFHLFGFADGTEFSPGGPAWVGERGPEIVNLPRGSRVVPNHRAAGGDHGGGGGTVVHRYESNIVVSGNSDAQLMERVRIAADEISRAHFDDYRRNHFNDDVNKFRADPYGRG